MKNLLKYEWYRLLYSYTLIYACLICFPLACITTFVIAGAPQSPAIYGLAFEFFIPQFLVLVIPIVFIADEQHRGSIKTQLLSGEKRYKIFFAKTLVYYFALFIVFIVYLLIISLMNAKGLGVKIFHNENTFVYFLRCASVGFAYCFMLSTILLFISVFLKKPILTAISDIILFLMEFLLKGVIDWRIADKIVPSLMIEQLIAQTSEVSIIAVFTSLIIFVSFICYILSLIIFCKQTYK